MADALKPGTPSKRDWSLSAAAFHRLLEWLDEGQNSQGNRYVEMRRRLVSYFSRNACLTPDDLADETLNRVARRLQEEGSIADSTPARYCYIVARFVLLEHFREPARQASTLDDPSNAVRASVVAFDSKKDDADQRKRQENMLHCLERCLEGISPDDRRLIFNYYQGEQRAKIENRRALAEQLGLTSNALNIRACRIRARLELCVRQCCQGSKEFGDLDLLH